MWARTLQHSHVNASQGGPLGALPQDLTSDGSSRKLGTVALPWDVVTANLIDGGAVVQMIALSVAQNQS